MPTLGQGIWLLLVVGAGGITVWYFFKKARRERVNKKGIDRMGD